MILDQRPKQRPVDSYQACTSSEIVYTSIFMTEDLIDCNSFVDYAHFVMQKVASEKIDMKSIMEIIQTERIVFEIVMVDEIDSIN